MRGDWNKAGVAKAIDHTLAKAIATERQVEEFCAEARANGFASVCVNPYWVEACARELAGSKVAVCAFVGFPLGASMTEVKAAEASLAVRQGADEIEVVANLGALKSGDWKAVERDLRDTAKAAGKATVKVVMEIGCLTDSERQRLGLAAADAGAKYVCAGSWFGSGITGGSGELSADDVRALVKALGGRVLVKASGGIRSYHDAIKLLEAGADRLGASSGVAVLAELPE